MTSDVSDDVLLSDTGTLFAFLQDDSDATGAPVTAGAEAFLESLCPSNVSTVCPSKKRSLSETTLGANPATSEVAHNADTQSALDDDDDAGLTDAAKKRRRLERNRESARLSRERRREQVDKLETQVKQLTQDNCSLAYTLSAYHAELRRLTALVAGREAPPAAPALDDALVSKAINPKHTQCDDEHKNNTPINPMPHRGIRVEGKPAELTDLPSILPLMAVSTLLAVASLCLGAHLLEGAPRAVARAALSLSATSARVRSDKYSRHSQARRGVCDRVNALSRCLNQTQNGTVVAKASAVGA